MQRWRGGVTEIEAIGKKEDRLEGRKWERKKWWEGIR
jgi:hypothetical protein